MRTVVGWIGLLVLVLLLAPPAVVLALRWVPPPLTAFMLQSEVRPVTYRWVPASGIPDVMRRAVIMAEDQKFWLHDGFDFEAIEKAMAHNRTNKRKRGASTISQQVAKNLFLWPGRSWFRKGVEVSFTVLIEALWSKPRILEMYLNIAEFGPGVYGVEAASLKFFGKPAAQMTAYEAARLAAVLPSPRRWNAANPGPYVQSRVAWILGQLGLQPDDRPAPAEEPEEPPDALLEATEPPPEVDEDDPAFNLDSAAPPADAPPESAEFPDPDAQAPAGEDADAPVETLPDEPVEEPADELPQP